MRATTATSVTKPRSCHCSGLPDTGMHETNTRAAATLAFPSRKLAQNAFFLFAGQVASTALSIVLTALLGRWLGAVEFGIYYLLAVMTTFAYVLVDWGQSAYLIRESARRHQDSGKLLGGALVVRVTIAFAAALATGVLVRVIGYDRRIAFLAPLSVACALPLALSQTYGYIFRARDRMDFDGTVAVSGKAITVAVTVPALLLGGGLAAVVLMQAVGGAGALLVALHLAGKFHLRAERPGRGIVHELARGGAPIAAFFVAMAVQPLIDAIILAKLTPPEVVGWYGAARNIMAVLFAPASILGSASFPELSRVSDSVVDLRRALGTTLRLLLGLGALAAVGAFLFADVAVRLIYGRGHFDSAAVVLQVFAPVLPLLFVDILFGSAITAVGKTKEIAAIKALSVAISTGLAIPLIILCQARLGNGGIGLALAFGFTESLMLAAFLRLLPHGAVDRSMLLDLLRAAATAGATVVIFTVLPAMTPWLAVPTCIVVFLALALISRLILIADLSEVADVFRGWLERLRSGAKD